MDMDHVLMHMGSGWHYVGCNTIHSLKQRENGSSEKCGAFLGQGENEYTPLGRHDYTAATPAGDAVVQGWRCLDTKPVELGPQDMGTTKKRGHQGTSAKART